MYPCGKRCPDPCARSKYPRRASNVSGGNNSRRLRMNPTGMWIHRLLYPVCCQWPGVSTGISGTWWSHTGDPWWSRCLHHHQQPLQTYRSLSTSRIHAWIAGISVVVLSAGQSTPWIPLYWLVWIQRWVSNPGAARTRLSCLAVTDWSNNWPGRGCHRRSGPSAPELWGWPQSHGAVHYERDHNLLLEVDAFTYLTDPEFGRSIQTAFRITSTIHVW